MKYATLFEYIVSRIDEKYSNILEGKADVEYERSFKSIPRDIFDDIILMDPKTEVNDDRIGNIGFGCKQLLLPKYVQGETDFVDNAETVTAALSDYYKNVAKYPRLNEFRSVADFLTFMADPENTTIDKAVQESNIDKLYRQYYSGIDRNVFDRIIAMDPGTKIENDKIGEVAKNLLLVCYNRGERDFLNQAEDVTSAIHNFYTKGRNYPNGKDNIQNFESVAEFITYRPISPTVADVAEQGIIEGRDFETVVSSEHYDVFKALTWEGSKAIGHARGAQNGWCTIGGSNGRTWLDNDGVGTFYKAYQPNGSKHAQVYQFISRQNPTDRNYNYNLAVDAVSGIVTEFRDGDNMDGAGGEGGRGAKVFMQVLLANPDLVNELKNCSEPLLRKCPTVNKADDLIKASNIESLHIKAKSDFAIVFDDEDYLQILKGRIKNITIENVEEIPYGCFAQFSALENLQLGEGLKKISGQAFKNCLNLKTITLPESLEKIGVEAFAGCVKLKGSIRIPDNLKEIELRAFAETHCRLKINKNRTTKLKMSPKDIEWIKVHVQSIKL